MGDHRVAIPNEATRASDDAPTLATVSRRGFWGSLVSRTLPSYSGPQAVGVTDIEVSLPPQSFGNFVHKGDPTRPAGLVLETVLFTLFYPAKKDPNRTDQVIWFPRLKQTVDGFLKMARIIPKWFHKALAYPIAALTIYGTTFPATRDLPLLPPPEGEQWPVILFSHGVGTSRLMYSGICGELASRGYVVAAVEHRDGTSPSSLVRKADGKKKVVDFLHWKDLHWPHREEHPTNDTPLRHVQLSLRLSELEAVLAILKKMNSGQGDDIARVSIVSPEDAATGRKWSWEEWSAKLQLERPIVAGHSLGGTTAIMASVDDRFSFTHTIAFDPAIQRLEPWNSTLKTPLLVVNSEEFAGGMDGDFPRLLNVFTSAPKQTSDIFHIPGSTHPSFSDISLLLPSFINRRFMNLSAEPEDILDKTVRVTIAFLKGKLDSVRNDCTHVKESGVSMTSSPSVSVSDINGSVTGTINRSPSEAALQPLYRRARSSVSSFANPNSNLSLNPNPQPPLTAKSSTSSLAPYKSTDGSNNSSIMKNTCDDEGSETYSLHVLTGTVTPVLQGLEKPIGKVGELQRFLPISHQHE